METIKLTCEKIGMKKGSGFRVRILLFALIFCMVFACLVIAACPDGDLDGDCIVTLDDLLILAEHWMDPDCADPNCGNLDGIHGVTMTDFAIMAQGWQKKGSRPVISEFLAANSSINQQEGFVDEDNDSSDWIEIHNPTGIAVNLESWFLTDTKSKLTKWRFPSVTINAGDYLIVFASGKKRANPGSELHTNFNLSADGEYLALVMPDGKTAVSEFDPAFPPQVGNISYGSAVQIDIFNLVDSTSTIHLLVPDDDSLGTSWTSDDFTESKSWITGLSGIGYDTFGMGSFPIPPQAHWTFDESDGLYAYDSSGNDHHGILYNNPTRMDGHIGSGALKFSGGSHVNCGTKPGSSTNLTFSMWIKPNSSQLGRPLTKINTGSSPGSGYTVMLRPESSDGTWDKAIIVRIGAEQNYGGWGSECYSPQAYEPGVWSHLAYTFDSISEEGKIYINGEHRDTKYDAIHTANGVANTDDDLWIGKGHIEPYNGEIDDVAIWDEVLTDSEIANLASGEPPYQELIQTDIEAEMKDINSTVYLRIPFTISDLSSYEKLSLRMKYDDGFVAYINGVEVARRNGPETLSWNSAAIGERLLDEALVFEEIDVSSYIDQLKEGDNVLAIHGLNVSASDGDYLLIPELEATSSVIATAGLSYFDVPTPGKYNNQPGYSGLVSKPTLSAAHGFYNSEFNVEINCVTEDAIIRYTIDGSTPTLDNGIDYTIGAPIPIVDSTCIRAGAFKDGWLDSRVETQTYIFLEDAINQPVLPEGFPSQWRMAANYVMRPDVVSAYQDKIMEAMTSIPTMSIVMDQDDLFGQTNGIYSNPFGEGFEWERPCSLEMIFPDGQEGFQISCGVRVFGRGSRHNNKLSFKLLFKSMYGPSKLNFKLFDDSPVTEYDVLMLRGGSNHSWVHTGDFIEWQRQGALYIRDLWARDAQLAMGQLSSHGRYMHLYINGLYWGLYNPTERPNAAFLASHEGGEKEEWDAVKHMDGAIDGTIDNWNQTMAMANAGLETAEAYDAIKDYIDIDNLIDYTILVHYSQNVDWVGNNWYAGRRRLDGWKWMFFVWDTEYAMYDVNLDITGRDGNGTPPRFFHACRANAEFRLRFADRLHRHLFNNGVLTPDRAKALFMNRANEINTAIIGESARWGDAWMSAHGGVPYTRDDDWLPALDWMLNVFLTERAAVMIDQYRDIDLYPQTSAPVFNINGSYKHGGAVAEAAELTMSLPAEPRYINITLLDEGQPVWAHIPTDDSLASTWTTMDFVPKSPDWTDGTTNSGVGYEITGGYENLIETDVQSDMYEKEKSVLCRLEFEYDGRKFEELLLHMKYDDGFVAYLNGDTEIARSSNVTNDTPGSAATGNHEAGSSYQKFPITDYQSLLTVGTNVLAIHGINGSSNSSDMLVLPKIVGKVFDLSPPASDIWFTTDGSDPRSPDGDINPAAINISQTESFTLSESVPVKARTLDNGQWSALNETTYAVGPVIDNLRITEIMYNPADPNAEFIELKNIGPEPINIGLVKFTNGIEFTFPSQELAAGDYVLVAQSPAELAAAAPSIPPSVQTFGPYTSRLNDGGEKIELVDAIGRTIQEFDYKDGWFEITDGLGFSLTIRDPSNSDPNDWDRKSGWRASFANGGSPGEGDSLLVLPEDAVIINELLSHADTLSTDWIEFYNTTDDPINIGGWFISDNDNDLMKYEIEESLIIPSHGYAVFYQNLNFGSGSADPGSHTGFAFSENGERVYLTSGLDGELTGVYSEERKFDPSASDIAFGHYVKTDGSNDFVAMSSNTPGWLNANPKIPSVIINEIAYHPDTDGDAEFVELYNRSGLPVTLYDSVKGVPWRLVDDAGDASPALNFEILTPPPSSSPITLASGEYLLLVKDKNAFETVFLKGNPISTLGVQWLEWGSGKLDNGGGDQLELQRPGDLKDTVRMYIRVDRVTYDDEAPWPTEPDSSDTYSLQRLYDNQYGNDAINWDWPDSYPLATPGTANPVP